MDPKLLDGPYTTFEQFKNNLDDSLNNASNVLFGVKPLSYLERTPGQKRKNNMNSSSDSKKPNIGVTKGWLVCSGGIFSFPSALSKLPCRNYATEGLDCPFGRTCKYDHKVYPKGFRRSDQAVVCDWIKKNRER